MIIIVEHTPQPFSSYEGPYNTGHVVAAERREAAHLLCKLLPCWESGRDFIRPVLRQSLYSLSSSRRAEREEGREEENSTSARAQ